MPVEYIKIDRLQSGYTGSNVDRPHVSNLLGATIMAFPAFNEWGKHKATGSCRAGALRIAGNRMLFASSMFKVSHAEETLVPDILRQWGAAFDYMYVDIEPCHSGKYAKNEGGCKLLIHNTFQAGKVFYSFDQDNYAAGMNGLSKQSNRADQITALRARMGVYE